MKIRALIICLLFFTFPLFAQTNDRDLVEKALAEAQSPGRDTSSHKLYHLFRDQMRGQCYYEPECVEFFPQAVHELGFLRACFSMLDRMTRDTYIGTATFPRELRDKEGKIHENSKAYRRRRKEK